MSNRWLQKKNVVGYGLGTKRVNGEKTGEEAMLFFVEKKTDDISDEDRIPATVDGKTTDVIETGVFSTLLLKPCGTELMNKTIVPIRGGLSISDGGGSGTLGAVVKDATTGKLLALTNAHVAGNPLNCSASEAAQLEAAGVKFIHGPTAVGLEMYQPLSSNGNQFGSVVKDVEINFSSWHRVDASVISIKSEYGVTPGIMGITKYAQPFIHPGTISVGTKVLKAGRTSGVTHGEILSMSATIGAEAGGGLTSNFENQILIEPDEDHFASPGDSGSVLCVDLGDERAGIIGLVFAANLEVGGIVMANRLDDVVDALGIRPWRGEIITGNDYPDVVSTGFGAVYEKDTVTFLSRTNDYVCDGVVCGLTPLTIASTSHELRSVDVYSGASDLRLIYTYLEVVADVDVDVGISINLECTGGAEVDASVQIRPTLDVDTAITVAANVDVDVGIRVLLDAELEVRPGTTATVDRDVLVRVSCEVDVSQAISAEVDASCPIIISLDAMADNRSGTFATVDADVWLTIESDITAAVTALDFSGDNDSVAACTSTNTNDLFYGASL